MEGRAAIALKHVNKDFGGFSIADLTLEVPEGCICGLAGENGAGKSTTIKLLMGAMRPDSGNIKVLGVEVGTPEFTKTKEDIGVVMDEAYFPEVLNAVQVGKIMAGTYRNWDEGLYGHYLARFHLPEKQEFKTYSRGMRMKLAIATALSHHPKLLVLDEATAGLDPVVRDEVLGIFNEFTREEDHSILIASHILSDLEKLCDYIAFIQAGRLRFCEEKDVLLEEYGMLQDSIQLLEALPLDAVVGQEENGYGGVRALIRRELVPADVPLKTPTIEDIILFTVKGRRDLHGQKGGRMPWRH